MAEELEVQLSPAHVPMAPGGSPTEVTVTIQNRSDSVAEYAVELIGLEPDWFTPPPSSIRLFPQDRDQLRFALRPPRRASKGSYVYRVVVRSSHGSAQGSAEGTLEVSGTVAYRLEVLPRRQTGRGQGTFQAQLTNTGSADVQLTLDGQAADGNCEVRFSRDGTTRVQVGQKVDVPLRVRPFQRPWVGPESSYNFNVTARPDDPTTAPQTVGGQFTYQPRLASWAPIRTLVFVILGVALALALIAAILPANGPGVLVAAHNFACDIPVIGSLCGKRAVAATCAYDEGFKAYAEAESQLIGVCVTRPLADAFGNVRQYSKNGVLFWQHDSNTVYFFKNDSLYAFLDEKSVLIHGPGVASADPRS
jgi:hypothetical protein